MPQSCTLQVIGHLHSDFSTKFGIPRQSGLVEELRSRLVFTPPYRDPQALRGLQRFSHLWLLWQFSALDPAGRGPDGWRPTVRPPRLGGNARVGVFATRSPFRPNPIGLSCVRLLDVQRDPALGPVLLLGGADLMDGTPILDIKPYLPYTDCRPEATGGIVDPTPGATNGAPQRANADAQDASGWAQLRVDCSPQLLQKLPTAKQKALLAVLAQDPRPAYQHDPERVYGFGFAGQEVQFTVRDDCLTVHSICPTESETDGNAKSGAEDSAKSNAESSAKNGADGEA